MQTHLAKNLEPVKDAEIEFVKACPKHIALPEAGLILTEAHRERKFVILNHSLSHGQMHAMAKAFKFHPTSVT